MSVHFHNDDWDVPFSKGSKGSYQRCYETHKPLPLSDGLMIWGGSCSYPVIEDADIYVGFDLGIKKSPKAYPWEQGESFLYYIQDMDVPKDVPSFLKLVDWIIVQLIAQKKVHLGCIGGHGRTGLVLSAIVAKMMGKKDAIQYVRDNYCHKAVETRQQVQFLVEHFGVDSVKGSKEYEKKVVDHRVTSTKSAGKTAEVVPIAQRKGHSGESFKVTPTKNPVSIWGSNSTIDKLL